MERKNWVLLFVFALAVGGLVSHFNRPEPPIPPGLHKDDTVAVEMHVYSSGMAHLGRVSLVNKNHQGNIIWIHVHSGGPFIRGTRRVERNEYRRVAGYVVLTLTRKAFRTRKTVR
jgi:hypothetical protein